MTYLNHRSAIENGLVRFDGLPALLQLLGGYVRTYQVSSQRLTKFVASVCFCPDAVALNPVKYPAGSSLKICGPRSSSGPMSTMAAIHQLTASREEG